MSRIPNWEVALAKFATAELGKPFVWGETNCVSLAIRALDVQCGDNYHACVKHFMSSELRAGAFVRKQGLAGIVSRLKARGIAVIPQNFEQVGDVRFVQTEVTIGASVLLGRKALSSTQEAGVALYDASILGCDVTMGVRECLP